MQNKNFDEVINYFKSGKFVIAEKKVAKLIEKFPNNYTLGARTPITVRSQRVHQSHTHACAGCVSHTK